jgi:hypothetical protein
LAVEAYEKAGEEGIGGRALGEGEGGRESDAVAMVRYYVCYVVMRCAAGAGCGKI